jgi:hypothetical protein
VTCGTILFFLYLLLRRWYWFVVPPPVPVRPASPLPPGVPTGPRNQNKYKDRDGNAPAVDGLDYGGTNKDVGGRTPSGEPEDKLSSRSVLIFCHLNI